MAECAIALPQGCFPPVGDKFLTPELEQAITDVLATFADFVRDRVDWNIRVENAARVSPSREQAVRARALAEMLPRRIKLRKDASDLVERMLRAGYPGEAEGLAWVYKNFQELDLM